MARRENRNVTPPKIRVGGAQNLFLFTGAGAGENDDFFARMDALNRRPQRDPGRVERGVGAESNFKLPPTKTFFAPSARSRRLSARDCAATAAKEAKTGRNNPPARA